MLIVALTGGIATGKSVVSMTLKELGCYVHHADQVAHRLMQPEKKVWKKIVTHFGLNILNPDKTINRSKLSHIIFNKEKERIFINKLIHPLVFKEKKKIIQCLEKEDRFKIFISEAALTIESGFTDLFDKIVVVYCDQRTQIKRLKERDKISQKEAAKKIKAQMPSKEKMKHADYIINSSGSLGSTIEKTAQLFRNLMQDYELKYQQERNS